MKTLFLFCTLTLLLIANIAVAQQTQENQIRRFRIGAKTLLYPNFFGGHAEFVLPMLDNKLSIATDITYLPLGGIFRNIANNMSSIHPDENVKLTLNYTYFNIGTNYYFGKHRHIARGKYIGTSYGHMGLAFSADNNGNNLAASGSIDFLQLKVGTKTGKKGFFFGFEIGYGYPIALSGSYLRVENGVYETGSMPNDSRIINASKAAGFILNCSLGIAINTKSGKSNTNQITTPQR